MKLFSRVFALILAFALIVGLIPGVYAADYTWVLHATGGERTETGSTVYLYEPDNYGDYTFFGWYTEPFEGQESDLDLSKLFLPGTTLGEWNFPDPSEPIHLYALYAYTDNSVYDTGTPAYYSLRDSWVNTGVYTLTGFQRTSTRHINPGFLGGTGETLDLSDSCNIDYCRNMLPLRISCSDPNIAFRVVMQSDGSYTFCNVVTGKYISMGGGDIAMVSEPDGFSYWDISINPQSHGAYISNRNENAKSYVLLAGEDGTIGIYNDDIPYDFRGGSPDFGEGMPWYPSDGLQIFMLALESPHRTLTTYLTVPAGQFDPEIGHSLSLEQGISIQYYVPVERVSDYTDLYLECMTPNYVREVRIGTHVHKLQPVIKGDYYCFVLEDLNATQMNDNITAVLYGTKENKTYAFQADSYSISAYAYSQLNKKNTSAELKSLCAELLRYGGAAQNYKRYRRNSPADAFLTTYQKSLLSDLKDVKFGNTNEIVEDMVDPVVIWHGKTLALDSRVTLRMVADLSNFQGVPEDLSLQLRYTDSAGKEITVILTEGFCYNEEQSLYAYDFSSLPTTELRTVISAAIYEGDTQLSPTLTYSMDTYGNNKTGTLLTLCRSLFAYSDCAKVYFATKE